ncbi:MAG TPA: DnaJ domain-containing protein [Stellaceae bacterium]|nr:DnaJ domain-containing protein [Stellaceae bacterium]
MPFFIGGVLLLLVLVVAGRAFVNADPQKLLRFFRLFAISIGAIGAAALLILLIASERLGSALALVGFLAPVLLRGKAIWRRWQTASGPSPGNVSEIETEYLRMRLDHDTGAMSGTVRRGRFAGRRLDELAEPELVEFWRECRIGDEASARLMESYLDRLRPDWRDSTEGGEDARARPGPRTTADSMTREEALAVLGLQAGADAAAIKKAHRELMMKLHPDQGGSNYLAAKINRAKEVLLD